MTVQGWPWRSIDPAQISVVDGGGPRYGLAMASPSPSAPVRKMSRVTLDAVDRPSGNLVPCDTIARP